MKTYIKSDLEKYQQDDWILKLLKEEIAEEEKGIRTNKWLLEMENKRMIYADVYGDILKNTTNKKVLDIGGGYNSLTKVLAKNSQYTLVDFLAHGGEDYLSNIFKEYKINWKSADWFDFEIEQEYDIVVANDIFPDVDQRMELFIEKFLPHCKELRLVLTYYNSPQFYRTKRTDDLEQMTFLSWDGEITALKLNKYCERLNTTCLDLQKLKEDTSSIYWNGRQVSYVIIKGDQ